MFKILELIYNIYQAKKFVKRKKLLTQNKNSSMNKITSAVKEASTFELLKNTFAVK